MVQFGQKLNSNKVQEWDEFYLDYKGLKKFLKRMKTINKAKKVKNMKKMEEYSLLETNDDFSSNVIDLKESYGTVETPYTSEEFMKLIKLECEKIDLFYQKKLKECQLHLESLAKSGRKVRSKTHNDLDLDYEDNEIIPKAIFKRESIKWGYGEIFRTMNLLHSYTILNYTGLVKIIKKHDKIATSSKKTEFNLILEKYSNGFVKANKLLKQISSVESDFADSFFNGNCVLARNELLIKQLPTSSWRMILTGLHMGMIIVLFFWSIWNIFNSDQNITNKNLKSSFRIKSKNKNSIMPIEILRTYRGIGIILSCFWAWSIIIYLWKIYRVNYVYIFEFDPRKIYSLDSLIITTSRLTILYFINLILYFKLSRGEISYFTPSVSNYCPLLLIFIFFYFLIFSKLNYSFYKTIFAPFYQLTFFNSFIGDVLTSLVRPIVDLSYSMCFYITGEWRKFFIPFYKHKQQQQVDEVDEFNSCDENFIFIRIIIPLIISLPLFIRFLQSIRRYYDTSKRHPNLTNALKYSLAYILVLLGAIHPSLTSTTSTEISKYKLIWAIAFAISTSYTFSWDVFIDWGLGDKKHGFLRERRMFPQKRIYYLALSLDLFLRFTWCLTLIPELDQIGIKGESFTLILGLLEVFRRGYWTLLRVEYEHLFNSQGYRRVDFIPLHFETKQKDNNSPKKEVIIELCLFVSSVLIFSLISIFQEIITGDSN